MNIVIYGSQYGTAKRYAEELSNRLGFELKSYEEVADVNLYDTIIYVGALYAGGVLGMKKTFKGMKDSNGHTIVIATVGLADPTDKTNTDTIKKGMKNQLPTEVYDKASIFHLRGGIDYSKLGFKHKTMMGMLYKKAVTLPEDKKTSEVRAMIETYNKQVDFNLYEHIPNNFFTFSNISSLLISPSLIMHGISFFSHSDLTYSANRISRCIQLSKAFCLSEHPSNTYGTYSRSL